MLTGSRMLAHFCSRYPRMILSFWVAFFIVFGSYGLKLPDVLKDHGLTPTGGDYAYVRDVSAAEFHRPDAPVILVFENNSGASAAAFRHFISSSLAQAAKLEGLAGMLSPLEQPEMLRGSYAYAILSFAQKPYEMGPVLKLLRERLPQEEGMTVGITGKTAVQEEVNLASRHDLLHAEIIGIPMALIILWLAFGGLLTAMLPVILGIVAVAGTFGVMYGLGLRIELSNFVLNVIPMVGLSLSIDFALIVVSRFREELAKTPLSPEHALHRTMAAAGKAVLLSAGCVMLGLMGLLCIPLPLFTAVTLGAMAVVSMSTLLTFTLLPALLTLLGPLIKAETMRKQRRGDGGRWAMWADAVMKRPLRMLLLASCLLLSCLFPLKHMKLAIPDDTSLPQGNASRHAMEVYRAQFEPPGSSQVEVLIEGDFSARSSDSTDWERAYSLVQRLGKDPNVLRVDSVFSQLAMKPKQLKAVASELQNRQALAPFIQQNKNRMLLQVTLNEPADAQASKDWVRQWAEQGKGADLTYRLGGEVKYQQEVFDALRGRLPLALMIITVSNYILLLCAFRSVLLPLKALLMNFLSLGAAFGLLTWMFQRGFLGMEPYDIAIMIPLFIFGLAFGISMDYGVLLLSRIAEAYERTGHNELAVRVGLRSSSRVITSAAAIMIAVTAPFAFAEVVGVKQLGIGIAAAIAIDASLIRMIVVPSLMKLMGRWNWWAPGQHRMK